MLPETLSNNLCSLRPNEEKLTFSAIFKINKNGEVKEEWFGKTVIKSNERLSYQEAKILIDSKASEIPKEFSLSNKKRNVEKGVTKALLQTNEIAIKIRKKRIGQGAIIFDKTEIKFVLDKNKSAQLLRGYQSIRKLNTKEKNNFNTLCRGSALRYLLTRSYVYLNTPKKALIKIKDPKEYLDKLNFHRKLNSFRDYN